MQSTTVFLFNSTYSYSKISIRTQEHDECDDYVTLIIILTYERVPDNHFYSTSKQGLNVYLLDSLIKIFVV